MAGGGQTGHPAVASRAPRQPPTNNAPSCDTPRNACNGSPMDRGLAPGGPQARPRGEVALAHPRHLRAVGRGGPRRRDRLVAPARPRLRQHDPGRVRDPGRVLRRHGDRQRPSADASPTASGRRCGCTALIELVLVVGRRRDAIHVPDRDRRCTASVAVALEGAPQLLAFIRLGLALLALAPATVLMGATLPTLTRHLSAERAPEPVVRAPVRGEHDRRDPRHARRRASC